MLRPCSLRARRAHSRYRAPNRRRVLKRRRVLNRWRMLRLLGSSLPIQCKSRHNRIVSTARRYLRLCLLPAKWEHVVPTYIQSGLTEIEVAHNMARRVATPRMRSNRKRMRRRRRRLKGRRRRRREEEGGGRMLVTGVSCCRRPGNLKRTILPPTSLEMVKQHDFVNNTETVSSSKLLPRAVAQNLLFLFEMQWVCRRAAPSIFDRNTSGLVWHTWACTIDRQTWGHVQEPWKVCQKIRSNPCRSCRKWST